MLKERFIGGCFLLKATTTSSTTMYYIIPTTSPSHQRPKGNTETSYSTTQMKACAFIAFLGWSVSMPIDIINVYVCLLLTLLLVLQCCCYIYVSVATISLGIRVQLHPYYVPICSMLCTGCIRGCEATMGHSIEILMGNYPS